MGNYSWTYRFGEIIELEGCFTVIEAYDGAISTGRESDLVEQVDRSITDVANIAQDAVEPSIHPSYLSSEGLAPSDVARDRTNYSLIWLIFTSVAIGILVILRGK